MPHRFALPNHAYFTEKPQILFVVVTHPIVVVVASLFMLSSLQIVAALLLFHRFINQTSAFSCQHSNTSITQQQHAKIFEETELPKRTEGRP
jgi:hypothetical protein